MASALMHAITSLDSQNIFMIVYWTFSFHLPTYTLFLPSSFYLFVCLCILLFCFVSIFSSRCFLWLSGDPLLSLCEVWLKEPRPLEEIADSWTRPEKVGDEPRTSLCDRKCSKGDIMRNTWISLKERPLDKSRTNWVDIDM